MLDFEAIHTVLRYPHPTTRTERPHLRFGGLPQRAVERVAWRVGCPAERIGSSASSAIARVPSTGATAPLLLVMAAAAIFMTTAAMPTG